MPATINGIGTTYLGKKDLHQHPGVCEKCSRHVQLEDYETRLWFTIVFIPVLPLARRQIVNSCPACTYHYAFAMAEWERISRESAAEGARKMAENPTDAEAALEQLWTLISLNKHAEAKELAAQLAGRFGENVDVQLSLGAWWEMSGDDARADAAFSKALSLAPDNPHARRAVAVAAIDKGDLPQARELLRFMEEPGPHQDVSVLSKLAAAYQDIQMHEKALELFGIIIRSQPRLGNDRHFRKLADASQKALPMCEPVLPRRSLWQRRWFRWAAVPAVLLGILFGANYIAASNRKVHVINGLSRPVDLQIDGVKKCTIGAGAREELRVCEGQHEAKFMGPNGLEDAVRFKVEGAFVGRFFDDRVRVLNAFGSGVMFWQRVGYAATKAKAGEPKTKWYVGAGYFTVDDVDHAFEELPTSVKTERTSGVIHKTGLSMVPVESPAGMVSALDAARLAPGERLLPFAEAHLWTRPDNVELLYAYYWLCVKYKQGDRCREFLARGLAPVRTEWHRIYQTVCQMTGRGSGLVAEYERLLEANPTNSQLIYLMGRVQPGIRKATPYMDRAIQADGRNPYPYVAKAYLAMAAAAFDEAKRMAEQAHQIAPDILIVKHTRFNARLAGGDFDELEREVRSQVKQIPESPRARIDLMTILVARDRADQAARELREYHRILRQKDPENVFQYQEQTQVHLLALRHQYAELQLVAKRLRDPLLAGAWQFRAAVGLGQWSAADRLVARGPAPHWQNRLLLAVAAHHADKARAEQWLKQAAEEMTRCGPDEANAAAMLQASGPPPAEAARDLAMVTEYKAAVLVALVQAGADKSLLDLAGKLNFTPGVAQHVMDQAIQRLKR